MRRFSRYLGARCLHAAVLLAFVTLASFVLIDLSPGDYFDEARMNPRLSPETLGALRNEFVLRRPLPVRYLAWASQALRGDLGVSIAYNAPVLELVGRRLLHTLMLTGPALAVSWALAVPLGFWMAARPKGWLDRAGGWLTSGMLAIPELVAACLVLLVLIRTGWLPSGGMSSPGFDHLGFAARIGDVVRHSIAPVGVLVFAALPVLIRHARTAGAEAANASFVIAARSQGIGEWRLWSRHLARLAANPLASLFGLSFGGLLSASLVVEVVLGWPGLGPLFLDAISNRDVFLVLGTILFSAAVTASGSVAGDILLYWCDPRIRGFN